jgi:ATP-binding cassette subfamily B protein
MPNKFPFYKQLDSMDCGPTCLRMVAKYYGRTYSLQQLRGLADIGREGVSLLGIARAAEQIGFRTQGAKISFETLNGEELPLPAIIHWRQNHFVVVRKVQRGRVFVTDPAQGHITYSRDEFLAGWASGAAAGQSTGVILLLEDVPGFVNHASDDAQPQAYDLHRVLQYLLQYKMLLAQVAIGLLISSLLQLVLPFLTQSIVDVGIHTANLGFITLILLAQLALSLGRASVEFLRSWILLFLGARVNISILSDFLSKLMRLPISYFDTKVTGDILQRIGDHNRIESFLTTGALNTLFAIINLGVFAVVLGIYSPVILLLFTGFSLVYVGWIFLFIRRRRRLDYERFETQARENSLMIQLIQGMQDIKLANAEVAKRWEWERLQTRLFKLSTRTLSANQAQQAGAHLLNEGKNILITFLAARAVVSGSLTLGGMLAIQYIIGQLNGPIEQLIQFVQSWQEARISLERLNEIHQLPDELSATNAQTDGVGSGQDLTLREVSFRYAGAGGQVVLRDVNLRLPAGKVTAIVGTSGSGKTTLLKLLLKFYEPSTGEIHSGLTSLSSINPHHWRSQCGVVMQEGFIFSDTIARNIAVGQEDLDFTRLQYAVRVANITDFISSLPLGYHTKIGAEGNGLSQGQKQRLLIARAVYKDPTLLFFDEATNSLDANNESIIVRNLQEFFHDRTVIIVAHRLSTVKNADHIVVLDQGRVVEQGTHADLIQAAGNYYELVRNQLELGA